MELRLNLATASLKDAEHAIFIIGAYFGMTNLPTVSGNLMPVAVVGQSPIAPPAPAATPAPSVAPVVMAGEDPAVTFGAHPAALPPDADGLDARDPSQVFAGNAASPAPVAPQGTPATPTLPSATAAPSAPIAAAPVGSPAAPAPAPAASVPPGVEVDATGLPWDARIHSLAEGGGHPKTADGVWRKKRGVQPLTVSQVEAELRQTMAAGNPATATQTPVPPPATPAPTVPTVVAPQPPVATSAPAPIAPTVPQTFEQLMPRITDAITNRGLPNGALSEAVTAYALPNIPALANRPDAVPSVWAYLQSVYPGVVI